MTGSYARRADSFGLNPDAFRALIELASDLVIVQDAESGRILDANEAACAAFRYDRAKLLELDGDALVAAPQGIGWRARRAQIEGAGGTLRFETTCRCSDGATFCAEVAARRVRLDDRAYVIATLRDVTERKRVEAALRASEERFRLLIDTLHVGVILQGPRAEILLSNPTARELLGLTEDQMLGKTSFDPSWNVVHEDGTRFPGDEHPVPRAIATGRAQRQVVMGVYRPARRDRAWLLVDAEPQHDAQGNVETVVCTFSDVTALKEAERALRVSEARLREAQRIARVGSFEWTTGSATVSWSDETYRLVGTDRARFVPTNEAVLALHPPAERARVMELFDHAAASNAASYDWETSLVHTDGGLRDVHVRGEFVRDERGAVTGVRGTLQDVTERKRAERALAESEERFRRAQKLEAIGRLAGGIAHDFNNMLSPILGFASFIRARLPEGSALREPIETIEEAAERAAALTKQLLAFSRHQVVPPRPVDVDDVLARLERILQRVIGEDIELITKRGAKRGRVLADPSQIEQIILNLAVNARDAMPKGGRLTIESSDVELEARGDGAPSGPHVLLSVSDTGTGIDDATRARLFEPFFTTKEPGKGTGLGLATVYAIARQCGGDVRVESALGQGARFDVYLPRHDGAQAPEERASRPAAARTRASQSERILVVEDDALVRRTTSMFLREDGYAVIEASGGADALRALESTHVDLLVSDVVMPGMSGPDLIAQARARRPGLKAVLLSGYSAEVLGEGAPAAAPIVFLAKPFKSSDLLRAVREALDDEPLP